MTLRLLPTPALWIGALAVLVGVAPGRRLEAQATPDSTVASDPGLQVRFRGRSELGGDWTRFRPCNGAVQASCEAGWLPRITPELQFGLESRGNILERLFVDVDYEQAREFSAANTLNLRYQGRSDEFLQSVEIGDVSFSLPESRFLTQSIPASNLGIRATGQAGPVSFQTVFAQQQGDVEHTEFRPAGFGAGQGFVRRDTLVIDDADYVVGQFFFLTDPSRLRGYPHIDVLALGPSDAPPSEAPGTAPIQLYRFEAEPVVRQQVEGYIQADAVAEDGGDLVTESGWFRNLSPDIDYFVHPSGLWVGLRRPLLPGEMLAVTYVAGSGDTIGDYNPERIYTLGGRPRLRLLRATSPNHQPGRPTWELEMRQIYRVSAANDVDASSIDLDISVGELSGGRTFTRGGSGEFSYLRLFGVDTQSPVDQVDASVIYRPGDESVGDVPQVPGTYLVFPTLRPFAAPPPLPAFGLDAAQTRALLDGLANPSIYDEPDPLERRSAGLFRLNLEFTARSEGSLSTFSLGAFGIRAGSERLMLGDYRLRPGVDYLIDYDIGSVTLLDPESLFARFPREGLAATWEQKSLFEIAPTTILGLGLDYSLGDRGRLSLLGMYQFERELVRRPQLGVESSAVWLGGINADIRLPAAWMDRALAGLPVTVTRPSSLTVSGEVALSLPNPNTQRDVFLDDFDSSNDLPLPRFSSLWRLGSAPAVRDGAEGQLPAVLGPDEAASLVWQHTWRAPPAGTDSTTVFEGFLPQEIDQQLTVVGSPTRESALRIAFGAGQVLTAPEPRWRSMTTALSQTGLDLSRSEFLEFYAAEGDSLTLVIDLGVVSEDAMFIDSLGATSGVKPDGTAWGLDRLDQEADPSRGEIWSDALDEAGVWGEGCRGQRGAVYRVGDPSAVCTAGNGRVDSEDLDGDGNLDTLERYVRYVVDLGAQSPFLVRSRSETGTAFRLYRIPLRSDDAINPAGLFTEADWRGVKQLRLTLAGAQQAPLILARPRIVGSRWVKRGLEGVLEGLTGDALGGAGSVEVGVASRVSEGDAYQPPPGVLEQLDDPTSTLSGQGVEFAERSLSLRYEGVPSGGRAEVVQRFPQRPRNFFTYRQARLWAVARRGDWGPVAPSSLILKIGSDADNFYLFKARLPAAPGSSGVTPSDWLPELLIDFNEWISLRRRAESFLIENPNAVTGEPLQFWSADSTYAVVLQDRARAPVLAAVREISLGVWNEGTAPASGEVWLDELRLSRAVRTPGLASHVELALDAGGVFSTLLTFTNRNPFFRQLRGDPEYLDRSTFSLRTTVQLDRFVPASWGVDLPVSVTHTRSGDDPRFLGGSDLRTDHLAGLRQPSDGSTRVGFSFRKTTPVDEGWYGPLLEGLEASAGLTNADLTTVTTTRNAQSIDGRIAFRSEPDERSIPVLPGFLGRLLGLLPDAWEAGLRDARVRWTPARLALSTAYQGDDTRIQRFDQILTLPGDSAQGSTLAPRSRVETRANVVFQPLSSLRAGFDWLTGRDLLDPEKVVGDEAVQALLAAEQGRLLGVDLGWETTRQLTTRLSYQPELRQWLRGGLDFNTTYGSYRDANLVRRRFVAGDSTFALQRNVDGRRSIQARASFDPAGLARDLAPQSTGSARWVRKALESLTPIALSWQDGINVRLHREVVDPDLAYQLGWIGLDGYRFLAGDTAAFLADRSTLTVGGGLQLPASLSLALDYQQASTATFDSRSDRTREDRTWPNVRISFADLPLPELAKPLLRRVTLSGGYVRRDTDRRFGGASEQRRRQSDVRVPLDASVAWAGILNTTYRGSFDEGTGRDPTGLTDRGGQLHSVAVTSSFLPPWGLAERLIRPVAVALRATYSRQQECRVVIGAEDCVPFVDQLHRSLSLTLDSSVPDLDLGLEFAYVDRRSFVGQRGGTTQFQLVLFGQFQAQARLFAGDPGR